MSNSGSSKITNILMEEDKPLDIKYYLHLFYKNISIIITFFVIAMTIASIYVAKKPKVYESTASMVLERPRQALVDATSTEQVLRYRDDIQLVPETYFEAQRDLMLGSVVLGRVVNELNLKVYFETDSDESAINGVRSMISIERASKKSHLILIKTRADDPNLAANLANSVAKNFIRKAFEDSLYYDKEILTWLQEGKKDEEGYVTVTDPSGQLVRMKYSEMVNSLPAIQADPVVRQLQKQKSEQTLELETALRQYREKHPIIIKARANLKFIEESINKEKDRIIASLKAKAEGQLKIKPGRIIEEAKPPDAPIERNSIKFLVAVGLGSLTIIIFIIFLMDYFDDTIHVMEDFERKGILMPFLGPLPLLRGVDNTHTKVPITSDLPNDEERIAVEEAFRYVRVAINFSAPPESLKVLALTSCLPGDGKSYCSTNLASSLAMDGNRVLLVDSDMRRPVIHRSFGLENDTGLSNYLTSNIELESVIKECSVENLSVICSGPISPNPSEILGSDRMAEFLKEITKQYDRVILDCPPLTGIGDGFVVGSQIGHIILVVSAAKTPAELIRHTQQQLDKMSIKVLGTVLNRMNMERERYGGYTKHYYSTYNKYYRKT